MNHKLLKILQTLLQLWPWNKGKQTLAHHFYVKIAQDVKGLKKYSMKHLQLVLDLADRIQAIFYLTGLYEPDTVKACSEILSQSKNAVYIDVGANVGLIALQVLDRVPQTQAHLFEADPKVFQKLKSNFEFNPQTSAILHQRAVCDRHNQVITFKGSDNENESGWGRIDASEKNHDGQFQVQSVSLDQYLEENQIREVDLLKIDVEGAEELVLKGARRSLETQKFRHIICELNEGALASFGSTGEKLKELFHQFGYMETARIDMNVLYSPRPKRGAA